MTYDYQIGDGAHALDVQEFLDWKRGYQVIDAAGGSNLVDDNATSDLVIRAAAGDINAGGTTVTCTQDTIDLSGDVDPDDPRKVTVYRTPAGALATSAGTPEPAQDTGESRRNAYRPSPPTLSGTDGVVLATVWIPAGASSVTNADIRDRRLPAELPLAQTSFADLGTDPAANGEVQRNGADLKAFSGGAVRNLSNIGSGGQDTATIDDTDSPFATSDEAVIYADTSAGAVTVTLSSADAALGNEIRVVNIDGSNAVTVDTEGSETIDPNADTSKTITQAGWGVSFTADGSNWDSTLAAEHESVSTGGITDKSSGNTYDVDTLADSSAAGAPDLIPQRAVSQTGVAAALEGARNAVFNPSDDHLVVASFTYGGISTVDTSIENDISVNGFVSTADLAGAHDVDLDSTQDYALVVTKEGSNSQNLVSVDISSPGTPSVASTTNVGATGRDDVVGIVVDGSEAYMVDSVDDAFLASDVSSPSSLGSTLADTTFSGFTQPADLDMSGSYVTVCCASSNSVNMIDISTPSSPTQAGSLSDAKLSNAQSVVVDGDYAFVGADNNIVIVDISTPSSPSIAGDVSSSDIDNVEDVAVRGDYLYAAADGSDTVITVDISSPSSPNQIYSFTPYSATKPVSCTVGRGYLFVLGNTTDKVYSIG